MTLQAQVGSSRRRVSPDAETGPQGPALRLSDPAPPPAAVIDTALEADNLAPPACNLAEIWEGVMDRRLHVHSVGTSPRRTFVLARTRRESSPRLGPLSRIETAVLVRVLCGEQQKAVAVDLGIACSTASKWYTQALEKLNLDQGPIPLPLIIAAQAWFTGRPLKVSARAGIFEHDGVEFLLVSVPRPMIAQNQLTQAEQEVACMLIEGDSRWEIALRRSTSLQTVACQLRGIFSKFRLSGRYALIRQAVDLGWFR